MSNSRAVACCLLNISEARNAPVVDRIARAAVAHQLNALPNASPNASPSVSSGTSSNTSHHTSPIQTSVLNVFRDEDYNRSVITLASTNLESLKKAVVDACTVSLLGNCVQDPVPRVRLPISIDREDKWNVVTRKLG